MRRSLPSRSRDDLVAGRYLLCRHLGTGAMGSVWQAVDQRTGDPVALKLLGPHDPGSAALLRFVREQAVRIDHPHVLAPVGWVAEDDLVALATTLVRGGTVEDLLVEHGPLPTTYAVVLLGQLLDALGAVHRAGVLHRDVKPANLLLEPTGTGRPRLLLADFGVAVVAGDSRLTRVPGAVGTDGYLAPELVRGDPGAGRKSGQGSGQGPSQGPSQGFGQGPGQDLYAAGVVGIQLLTGHGPGAPVPPGPLAPLLTALTHPDPSRRPADAHEALAWLRAVDLPAGPPWSDDAPVPSVCDRLAARQRRPAVRAIAGDPGDRATTDLRAAALVLLAAVALLVVALLRLL